MIVNMHEAKTHLSRLVLAVANGEDVIIAKAGKKVAKLVPCPDTSAKRISGRDRGKLVIPDSFDEPLPDSVLNGFCS